MSSQGRDTTNHENRHVGLGVYFRTKYLVFIGQKVTSCLKGEFHESKFPFSFFPHANKKSEFKKPDHHGPLVFGICQSRRNNQLFAP